MKFEKFNIYSGLIKAYESADGRKRLRTTASSTIKDLVGDVIAPDAIFRMADKARGNMTIFLNHEYKVPEDVLGSTEAAEVVERGADERGNPILDLDLDIVVNESNPRAVSTWDAIQSGVKLGTSIGAIVRNAHKAADGSYEITDLELLEASIVSLPANPRSWVQYAMKSLVTDEITTEIEEVEKTDSTVNIAIHIDANEGPHTENVVDNSVESGTSSETDVEETEVEASVSDEAISTASASEPTAQEASTSGSEPENALLDETSDDQPAILGDTITLDAEESLEAEQEPEEPSRDVIELKTVDVANLANALKTALSRIGELEKENAELKTKSADLADNFAVAKQIIDRIAALPLGRKTHFSEAVNDFRRRFPMYDDEFIKFLEK